MRGFICLLAALSLAFNLAQVEAGCGRSDPCTCEHHERGAFNMLDICACCERFFKQNGCPGRPSSPSGCQLYLDEDKYEVEVFASTPNSCRNNATGECREAIHQYAKEYPDACKESTRKSDGKLTTGAWALRLAENCPTSGSGKWNKPGILFFVAQLMVTYISL